ncbi:MAG: hypothetical protein KAS32_15470 [Candidatus Peribacteraceae bacterium]|nr:hypothetical protein [Candidatus Peribacteraceae bacterium]
MNALFVVPAMISPNVNPRIVPALAKVIERNIIISNFASFRAAAMKKYAKPWKSATSEDVEVAGDNLMEGPKTHTTDTLGGSSTSKGGLSKDQWGKAQDAIIGAFGKPSKDELRQPTTSGVEDIELPRGITFFNTFGLEPTYLTFRMDLKSTVIMPLSSGPVDIMVGVKVIPYAVKGVNNVLGMMKQIRSMSTMQRFWFSKWNSIKGKIPFTPQRAVRTGERKGEATDIIFAPNSVELSNAKTLSKMMSTRKASNWATLAVLSTYDFSDKELRETIQDYKKLVKGGWGDMVIVNESSETVHFCTQKLNACYELPFAYLKQVMNLSNIMDYAEVSKWTRGPFHVTSVGRAFKEGGGEEISSSEEVKSLIEGIIRE